jgi:hypothetical protein
MRIEGTDFRARKLQRSYTACNEELPLLGLTEIFQMVSNFVMKIRMINHNNNKDNKILGNEVVKFQSVLRKEQSLRIYGHETYDTRLTKYEIRNYHCPCTDEPISRQV